MLTIRKEQVEVFEQDLLERFVDKMGIHLRIHFSEQCKTMDDKQMINYVNDIIPKAKKYGLVTECDICKYLNLTMIFGKTFDSKPENYWMVRILNDDNEHNPSLRINRLYKEALKKLEEKEI